MTSIIGKYNDNNLALFNSLNIFANSTSYLKKMMNITYSRKNDLDELYRNPNYIWINELKIDLRKSLSILRAPNGEYPRIRKLTVYINTLCLEHFKEVVQSLHYLEELTIHTGDKKLSNSLDDMSNERYILDLSVFPKSLRKINIVNIKPIKFIFRHPSLKSIWFLNCSDNIIDIDECPRLSNFEAMLFDDNEIICTRERLFEKFLIVESIGNKPVYNSNIVVYDQKLNIIRSAFNIDNENSIYDEDDPSFTYITDKWVSLVNTTKIDSEFYDKRSGIENIDIKAEIPVEFEPDPRCHEGIKIVQCYPIHIGNLIYFENLELVNIYDDHRKSGDYEKLFEKNKKVKISFIAGNSIIYHEYFEKIDSNRLSFVDGSGFITNKGNIQSCLRFADMMKLDNFMINGPISYLNIDSDKFNYMAFEKFAFFTRKPYPYIKIIEHEVNIDSNSFYGNCDYLVIENSKCELIDVFFRKIVLTNCSIGTIRCPINLEIIASSVEKIIGNNQKNTRLIMTAEDKCVENDVILSFSSSDNNFKEFIIDGYTILFEKEIVSSELMIFKNCWIREQKNARHRYISHSTVMSTKML